MNWLELVAKLEKAGIILSSTTTTANGTVIYMLVGNLPDFPHGKNRSTWYPVIFEVDEEQIVAADEIDAILRHFWHYELDIKPARIIDELDNESDN